MRTLAPLTITAVLLGAAGTAAAQANPTFTYGKADDVKDVQEVTWTGTGEAGLVLTTGNSRTTTVTATGKVTRVDPKNKLEIVAGLAYVRSTILIAADGDGDGAIGPDEIVESTATTANAWSVKGRYDRYLTELNSLYASASVGADRPAGKDLVAGAQAGYSRRLLKNEHHEIVAELGYDFSYEDLAVGDGVAIHSARAFTGYKGTVKDSTAVEGSVEVLSNLNHLATIPEESSTFDDTRVNASVGLTTKITADISLSFSIAAKFDNRPAPRPPLSIPYEAGFVPVADKLDTITKATLIVALF